MHVSVIFRVLGVLLMCYSCTMVPPAFVAIYFEDGKESLFFTAFMVTLLLGLICWLPASKSRHELRVKDGFVIVVMFWVVLGLTGAIPFLFSDLPAKGFTNAVFESISALTTTGATVFTGLDDFPKSILYYRQQLQWFGGMGIIVLAVAVLPMLGIGGMQLYRAETPGPLKEAKLTPRITETAKSLWLIYVGLTLACALCYRLVGLDWFEAIAHAFSTVSIGGFSTHDASIGFFDNSLLNGFCVLFMFLSGVNFALHFVAWHGRSTGHYFRDPEFVFYIKVLGVMMTVNVLTLVATSTYPNFGEALRCGVFETISVATTTGFSACGFSNWPPLVFTMLMMGAFMGCCAGSTGGGIKQIRILLMFKQGFREIKRLIHPNGVFTVKLGGEAVNDRVIQAVWGFIGVYVFAFVMLLLAILATGVDFITGLSAVVASINNLGPGLGEVASHYGDLSAPAKWVLCFAMLLGRLEVFTLLVLFSPMFWRR